MVIMIKETKGEWYWSIKCPDGFFVDGFESTLPEAQRMIDLITSKNVTNVTISLLNIF